VPLATEFAARGIAALVYDKRGTGQSTGDWRTSPFEALAEDAAAGVANLRNRPDIASSLVGIWGGSEGGWIAPAVAARDSQIAFVIDTVRDVIEQRGLRPADMAQLDVHIDWWNGLGMTTSNDLAFCCERYQAKRAVIRGLRKPGASCAVLQYSTRGSDSS
jgi:alpha/beta superfamily hydrolase